MQNVHVVGGAPLGTLSLARGPVTVRRSARVRSEVALIPGRRGAAALTVQGSDLEIDFQGATLLGSRDPATGKRERFEGVGLDVSGCRNITIRNARIHGYRFNIRAVNSPGLRLIDCDVSWSRAELVAEEGASLDRWLELRALKTWRASGAGIWLEGCTDPQVLGVTSRFAQNGIVLVSCLDARVVGCDACFNSGWGLALWASSRNLIAWNRADFVNRPWREGWGADAAGLAMVNECHHNLVVANSLTHSGDGLFLTDRTNGGYDADAKAFDPLGGCDGNIIAYNDGSCSSNNAFEATFSTNNVFYRNYANDSRYGFWLGFAQGYWLLENEACRNAVDGIAIEHGRGNQASQNTLVGNGRYGICLWADRPGATASHPSTDIVLAQNAIRDCEQAVHLENCTDYLFYENECIDAPWPDRLESTKSTHVPEKEQARYEGDGWFTRVVDVLKARPSGFRMYSSEPAPWGVQWLLADPYGPRCFEDEPAAWRRLGDGAAEVLLQGLSLARFRVEAESGVLMDSPTVGVPFRVAGPPGSSVTVHHKGRSQRIVLE